MNNFLDDLNFSHESEDYPFWEEVYSKAFPSFKAMTNTRTDGQLQRLGIDRTIILSSGKAVYVDEKVRRKDYGDILLEYLSNDTKGSPGWVEKPLFCDYIAYAILPTRMCFLFPVPQLQAAWIKNKSEWMKDYHVKQADNNGYKTWSCPVPIPVVFKAIGSCLRISFSMSEVNA